MHDSHGGDLRKAAREYGLDPGCLVDFSASINPLGPPPQIEGVLARAASLLSSYPEPRSETLCAAIASAHGVHDAAVIAGNGSCDLLHLVGNALRPRRVLIPIPAFAEYETVARRYAAEVLFLATGEERGFAVDLDGLLAAIPETDILFLGHPNSPTGNMLGVEALQAVVSACEAAQTMLLLDAVFVDFVQGWNVVDLARLAAASSNLLLLCSFTKLYAIPGLRLGYLVGAPVTVEFLVQHQPPWSVNSLAQAVGEEIVHDGAFAERSCRFVEAERRRLLDRLADLAALEAFPGCANFLLARLRTSAMSATQLCHTLAGQGILLRDCTRVRGLGPRFVRFAVRSRADNDRLLDGLQSVLKDVQ